ncbi:MAG: SAM-dependent methyltransferase [Wenzhouxiangellaceae bacterium]|nr:SAM-dependent methyltransferase [Wenzhouxiangellaceae bacterium]
MSRSSLKLPEPPAELARLSEQLCTRIVDAIERDGPIPFSRYMQMALYEPGLGYYVNGLHKFGAAGDFVTAPEHGALFAQAVARQLDRALAGLGDDWTLLEAGPGSGALLANLLPAISRPPARCLLLEPSAMLREVQRETLSELHASLRRRIEWIDRPPSNPFAGAIVANEVIDALPVERWRVGGDGIEQLLVDYTDGRFGWTTVPAAGRLNAALERALADLEEPPAPGFESEICIDLPDWLATLTGPLVEGLALLVDYGYPRREYYHPDRDRGTLVCHYRHRAHFDPFVWPGLTDLSAFVDFTALAEGAVDCGLDVAAFTSQAGFVLGAGVHERIEQAEDELERLRLAGEFKRLVLPGEMGEKFKVMALTRGISIDRAAFAPVDQLGRL